MSLVEERLPEAFPETNVDTEHGVRLSFPGGSWVLVRPSGTEPYIRIYAESRNVDKLISGSIDVVEHSIEDAR